MILSKARSSSTSSHGQRSRDKPRPTSGKGGGSYRGGGSRGGGGAGGEAIGRLPVIPDLNDFVEFRDYTGAIVLLQFKRREMGGADVRTMEWLAYCHFHHGEHDRALEVYRELLEMHGQDGDLMYYVYIAACLFYMGLYEEAEEAALKGPECPLQIRILFHVAHKQNDERKLVKYHAQLGDDGVEDQLTLASIHYSRGHHQEASEIYKQFLTKNRPWLALNIYVALCYYNLEYHDVSLEFANNYLEVHPDSAIAVNVKACNNFKLYNNGKAAEVDMKLLEKSYGGVIDNDLVRHNQVVFQKGAGALQVLPPLIDIVPEARLNLAIFYLKHDEAQLAYDLVKSIEPSTPQEFVLKAVTMAAYGQEADLSEPMKQAQQLFQIVGTSASECDTILGRQCMASCFLLLKQFDDTMIYLKSIKAYSEGQDEFLWNYAIVKAASHEYQEAEEILLQVCNLDTFRGDYLCRAWLCHCFIMNGKACLAWDQYLHMEPSQESFSLLLLIANECYKAGQFIFAAKAFAALERMDEGPDYWEGKRGACLGVFRNIVLGKEPKESLQEVMKLLRSTHPEVESILVIMHKWAKENGMVYL